MPEESEESGWNQLVEAARRRDAAAEDELVGRLYPRIIGIVRVWKCRRETADDLAQEVFLRVFGKLDQFRGGSFPAWVDAICRNVCFNALRRQRVRPEWNFTELGGDAPACDGECAPQVDPADIDAAEIIAALLARLRPEEAWLLREVELAGRSIGEVSREMGWTAVGGRLRLFRARQALKRSHHEWSKSQTRH